MPPADSLRVWSTGQSAQQQTWLALPQKLKVLPPLFASLQKSHLDTDPTVRKPEALLISQCLALPRVPWRPGLDTAGVKVLATAQIACKRAARGNFGCVWGSESVLSNASAEEKSRSKWREPLTKGMWAGAKAGLHAGDKRRRHRPYDETIDESMCTYMGGMRPRTGV